MKQKIQDELVIAREIVINDAESSIRYKLTKRQTQEEVTSIRSIVHPFNTKLILIFILTINFPLPADPEVHWYYCYN